MPELIKIACVDFGATSVCVQVLGYPNTGLPGASYTALTELAQFDTTKYPNNPDEDYRQLYRLLSQLKPTCDFDGIAVGFAARLDQRGVIAGGGNLNWNGKDLVAMLASDFFGGRRERVLIDNDGAMLAAVELKFGALRHQRRSPGGLVVAPGTGIAVCLFLPQPGGTMILPGEGAHMVIDTTAKLPQPSQRCGCGNYCVESMASGRVLDALAAQQGVSVSQLSDDLVTNTLAPPLGTLVANYTRLLPTVVQVVMMSGGIAHKRPDLISAVEQATARVLHGYVPTPRFVLSEHESGGVLGCLARWQLAHHQ